MPKRKPEAMKQGKDNKSPECDSELLAARECGSGAAFQIRVPDKGCYELWHRPWRRYGVTVAPQPLKTGRLGQHSNCSLSTRDLSEALPPTLHSRLPGWRQSNRRCYKLARYRRVSCLNATIPQAFGFSRFCIFRPYHIAPLEAKSLWSVSEICLEAAESAWAALLTDR